MNSAHGYTEGSSIPAAGYMGRILTGDQVALLDILDVMDAIAVMLPTSENNGIDEYKITLIKQSIASIRDRINNSISNVPC
jgi:hypothetical protein